MKLGFALLLSREGIGLLQRGGDGWLAVDEVSLDDPDLASKLETLRLTAEVLAREAGEPKLLSKLILPNSEILYEDVLLPDEEGSDAEIEIERHLDGRTPYSVADLTYDYVLSDQLAQVAVVARETLEEAESFATENGFNPVCFCALPPAGAFIGEPMFGLTKLARNLLPQGIPVERGNGKLNVTGAVDLPELPVTEPIRTDKSSVPIDEEPVPVFRSARARPQETELHNPETRLSAVPSRLALNSPGRRFQSSAATAQALRGALSDFGHMLRLKPIPAAVAATVALSAVAGWSVLSPSGTSPTIEVERLATSTQPELQTPAAPAQSIPDLAGYRSQASELPDPANSQLPARATPTQLSAVLTASPSQPSGLGPPLRNAPSSHVAAIGDPDNSHMELSAVPDATAYSASRARLAGVSSTSPQRPIDLISPPAPAPTAPLASAGPGLLIENSTGVTVSDDPVSSTAMAALAPPTQSPQSPEAGSVAPARSGIAPESPADVSAPGTLARLKQPEPETEDVSTNVTALSLAENLDSPPDVAQPPIAPNELLRTDDDTEVVLVSDLSSEELEKLAGLRPDARPKELVPPTADEAIETDPVLAKLQALRPTARPKGLKPPAPVIQVAVNDAADVPLAERPKKRPSKISQMAAQRVPQKAPKATPEQAAAAAAIVAPQKKTSYRREKSTVARRATMRNALPTSQVALIGVYGSDSKRRALVRLPSGRYVKVNVGDRVDGGKVASIGRNSMKYVKGGRSKTLKVPES